MGLREDIQGYSRKLEKQAEYMKNTEEIERNLVKIVKSSRNKRYASELILTKGNRDLILEFDLGYTDTARLRPSRRLKYFEVLPKIAHHLGVDFDKATIDDIKCVYRWSEQREDVGPWTKETYRVALKMFYKWLKGNGEEYPPEVKWIKAKKDKGAGTQIHI